jgi:hypothetical protein
LLLTAPFFRSSDGTVNSVVIDEAAKQGSDKIFPMKDPVRMNGTVSDSARDGQDIYNKAEASANTKTGEDSEYSGPGTIQHTGALHPDNPVAGSTNGNRMIVDKNGKKSGRQKSAGIATNDAVAGGGEPTNSYRKTNSTVTKVNPGFNGNDAAVALHKETDAGTANNKITGSRGNTGIVSVEKWKAANGATKDNTTTNTSSYKETSTQSGIAAVSNRSAGNVQVSGNQATRDNGRTLPGTEGQSAAVKDQNKNAVAGKAPQEGNMTNAQAPVIAETVIDSTAAENPLEKLLKEKQSGEKKEETMIAQAERARWNIKPQMAPVFYNSLSSGSPIDSEFAGNSKSYDNDLSYGLGINYAVSSRISIRTGINTVNLSYSTNDIQFYAALNEQTPNIAARGSKANIVVQNGGSAGTTFVDDQLPTQTFNGSLRQKMGFIEVPMELSYKLLDSRFGIDVIGGISTLFLNENNVSVLSSQGLQTDVGEAENLNNVHFSTNIGIGFKYRFWKAFEANFEPMFKYQVNTFSSDAGNFKPYFIGLYSGISFSF